jgi:hypothetical protein
MTDANTDPPTDADDADKLDGEDSTYYAAAADLDDHAAVSDAHHAAYTDSDAQAVVDSEDTGNVLGATTGDYSDLALGKNASAGQGNIDNTVAVGRSAEAISSYGIALGYNAAADNKGVALGSDCDATGGSSVAVGRHASSTSADTGVLGVPNGDFGPNNWEVPGDFSVTGSKNFIINHPSKPHTHDLRHSSYEGPVAGGLIYNDTVTVTDGTGDVALPGYVENGDFGANWTAHVSPVDHFGRGYVDVGTWTLHADTDGEYHVTVLGERTDPDALANAGDRMEKPKGETWAGEPRSYYRDAPGADPDAHDGVHSIKQFVSHHADCHPEPCSDAFEHWRVTFTAEEKVDVDTEPMGADPAVVVEKAREKRAGDA